MISGVVGCVCESGKGSNRWIIFGSKLVKYPDSLSLALPPMNALLNLSLTLIVYLALTSRTAFPIISAKVVDEVKPVHGWNHMYISPVNTRFG